MRPDNAATTIIEEDDNPFVQTLIPQPSPSRYPAKRMAKPITFFYQSPQAGAVFITGDFNNWHPTSHALVRQADGGWLVQIPLPHGHHRYLLLVDGKPVLDSRAMGTTQGPQGKKVSLVAVS